MKIASNDLLVQKLRAPQFTLKSIFLNKIDFVSFLSFLWLDKIGIEEEKKQKSGNGKIKIEDKTIEDGLDLFWKKV